MPFAATTFSAGLHICIARSNAYMLLDTPLPLLRPVDLAPEASRYSLGTHRHYVLRALRMLIFSWGVFAT